VVICLLQCFEKKLADKAGVDFWWFCFSALRSGERNCTWRKRHCGAAVAFSQ